jgi:hypothetical protein
LRGRETTKPGAGPGFVVDSCKRARSAHPAGFSRPGRRAREVMPAAMSALLRTSQKSRFRAICHRKNVNRAMMPVSIARCNRNIRGRNMRLDG